MDLDISSASVKRAFSAQVAGRIYERQDALECAFEVLKTRVQRWQSEGKTVVFVAGVFDVLHLNHLVWLTQCRLLGANKFLITRGSTRNDMSMLVDEALGDSIRLVVTLDTDQRVRSSKSRQGGRGVRPILSWRTRAEMVARQYMGGSGPMGRALVDMVTAHGDDACTCTDCPQRDNADMAAALGFDLIVVNRASLGTIEKLERAGKQSTMHLLAEGDLAYQDDQLGDVIKTTTIARHASR